MIFNLSFNFFYRTYINIFIFKYKYMSESIHSFVDPNLIESASYESILMESELNQDFIVPVEITLPIIETCKESNISLLEKSGNIYDNNKSNILGIFLNNTNSELKYQTNLNNYNNLKNNFNSVLICDIEHDYSLKLKNNIQNNIFKYFINSINNIYDTILFALNNINIHIFDYITFINDEFIYCSDLKIFFDYFKKHNLDLCSYTDSSEMIYHYQLNFFSIHTRNISILINFLENSKDDITYKYNFHNLFDKAYPFLKTAYIYENLNKNIFYNDNVYEFYMNNNLLPIININRLINLKNNFKINVHLKIPNDFDFNIYKNKANILDKDETFIYNHFLKDGQFQIIKYKNNNKNYNNTILPEFIRSKLEIYGLLYLFDIPNDFDTLTYKILNDDLNNLNEEELIKHWINYGKNENRKY